MSTLVITHDKEHKLYRISLEKFLNKQQQIAKTNPGDGGESDFQNCHNILFKMSSIHQEIMRHEKKQGIVATQWRKINRNCP